MLMPLRRRRRSTSMTGWASRSPSSGECHVGLTKGWQQPVSCISSNHVTGATCVSMYYRSHNQRVLWVGNLHDSVTNEVC